MTASAPLSMLQVRVAAMGRTTRPLRTSADAGDVDVAFCPLRDEAYRSSLPMFTFIKLRRTSSRSFPAKSCRRLMSVLTARSRPLIVRIFPPLGTLGYLRVIINGVSDPKTVARERHARWRKANPDRWRTMCRAASKRAREREPLKGLWAQMIQRCTNWKKSAFKADMGPRPPGTQIERKDNSGPYSPKNCAWVTSKVQNRNPRNNRVVDYEGVSR